MTRMIRANGVLGHPDADAVVISDGRITVIGRAADLGETDTSSLRACRV
jgi:predicted amidohydrolase YtcJ